MKKFQKGFTLIELLVVIAIIGILSSVVLASLNNARGKARDAAIQSNLNTVRKQAELYYAIEGNYGILPQTPVFYTGNCLTSNLMFRLTGSNATGSKAEVSSVITNAIAAALSANQRNVSSAIQCRMSADRQAYMVMVRLKSLNNYWCVDNTGNSKQIGTSFPATGVVVCP